MAPVATIIIIGSPPMACTNQLFYHILCSELPLNTPGDIEAALNIVMSGWGHRVRGVKDARKNHTVPGRGAPVDKDARDTTTYLGVLSWPTRTGVTAPAYPETVFRSLISQK